MASNTGSKLPGDELMTWKNFRGGGLLFECLARLGEEPRTGDHRLSIGTITVGPRMTAVGGRRRFRSFD